MMMLNIRWEENLLEMHSAKTVRGLGRDFRANYERPALRRRIKEIKKLIKEGRAEVLDLQESNILSRDQHTAYLMTALNTVEKHWKEYTNMADIQIQIPTEYHGCKDIHLMPAPHDGKFIIASPELKPMIGFGKTPDDWKVIEPDSFLGKEVDKHVRGMIRRREEVEANGREETPMDRD